MARPIPISRALATPSQTTRAVIDFEPSCLSPIPDGHRIHVKILGADVDVLTTQMYVAGNPENEQDGLYRRLGRASELVTVALEPGGESEGKRATFDIVLGPNGVPNSG